MKVRGTWRVLAAALALAGLTACGDDDETASAAGAADAYCDVARQVDTQGGPPTVEQLEELRDTAPDAIADDIDAVVPVFLEAVESGDAESAFESEVVQERFPAIEAFQAEACGLADTDSENVDDVDPAFAAYCEQARELDEQEDFPTAEQMEVLRANAPEEIAAEVDTVVSAFLAAGDDPFAAFEAPGVEEAFGPIEAFEAEHCGIGAEDDEEEQDESVTQLDPTAARVDVVATEYAFDLSSTPAAGRTSFVMANEGEERHVMYLFRVEEGSTMEEVQASEGEEGVAEDWESDTAAAGEEAVLTADLAPGEYGLICYIPDPSGVPHLEHGMVTTFTVP